MQKLTGIFIMVLSIIGYALITPLLKKTSEKIPPFTAMAISMFVLFFASLLVSLLFEKGRIFKISSNKSAILTLVVVGLINTAAFWLWIQAFRYMPIWHQTMFQLLTPIFAGVFSYFILGEMLSVRLFIGLLIISFGLFVAIR